MSKKLFVIMGAFAVLLLVFTACDTIDNPVEGEEGPATTDTTMRKVLIEKFTGYRCGNCPEGNVIAHELEEKYKDKVFSIAVHASYLAEPLSGDPDYTTEVGYSLLSEYGVDQIPSALINRQENSKQMVQPTANWAAATFEQLNTKAEVLINLTPALDVESKKITLDVEIEYLKDQGDNAHRLTVYIVEDKVIGKQTWYGHEPEHITDYEHHNMLRGSMNTTWGEVISESGTAVRGHRINKTLEYSVTEDWNLENLKLVAFVSEDNGEFNILNVEWCNLTDESININSPKNMVIINYEDGTTVEESLGGFGGDGELDWNVNLENTSEKEEGIIVGYKIKNLVDGHMAQMCTNGACKLQTKTDYEDKKPYVLQPGEITAKGKVSMHLFANDITGTSVVEFYYFSQSAPKDTVKREITFKVTE